MGPDSDSYVKTSVWTSPSGGRCWCWQRSWALSLIPMCKIIIAIEEDVGDEWFNLMTLAGWCVWSRPRSSPDKHQHWCGESLIQGLALDWTSCEQDLPGAAAAEGKAETLLIIIIQMWLCEPSGQTMKERQHTPFSDTSDLPFPRSRVRFFKSDFSSFEERPAAHCCSPPSIKFK